MINIAWRRHSAVIGFVSLLMLLAACSAPSAYDQSAEPTTLAVVAVAAAASTIESADVAVSDAFDVVATSPSAALPAPTATEAEPTLAPSPSAIVELTEPTALPSVTANPVWPTAIATPSPRAAGTPPRVGIQVGHWKAAELPEELARFRTSTGAFYNGITEAELNYDIAIRVQALLEAEGVVVDLLPATIPPAYDADAFLSIHADGSTGAGPRGWKLATPWRASQASLQLLEAVAATYGEATGMPQDFGGVTVNMRGYYAFNYRRHEHAVGRTTPAIIVETGFMTNAADRDILFNYPDRVASGIAQGVLNYLSQRDPNNGAALLPPDLPNLRTGPNGAVLRSSPSDDASVLARMEGGERIFAIDRRDGWYQVFARNLPSTSGWIKAEELELNTDPQPAPTSTNP